MSPEEVQALLENALPDCQFQVATDGGHFNIVAIGDSLKVNAQFSASNWFMALSMNKFPPV